MNPGQLPNAIRSGDVVWVDDPFDFQSANESGSTDDHPYVIISTDAHPFHGTEYLAMLITRTQRLAAVPIPDQRWEYGSLSAESYISPWVVVTLKERDVDDYQGKLTDDAVQEAVAEVPQYIGL